MVPAGLWNVLPVKVQGEIIEKPIKFLPHGSPLETLPPESHQQEEKVTKVLPVIVMVPSMFNNSLRVPTAVSLLLLCLLPADPVRCRRDEKKRSPIYPRSIKESLCSPRGAALCAGGALLRLIIGRPRPRAGPRPPPAHTSVRTWLRLGAVTCPTLQGWSLCLVRSDPGRSFSISGVSRTP